jgi:FMN phosphatase YigB (HAD superfamily)
MPERHVVVFDVDNTLYDYVDFFAPSFRALERTLSRAEGIPEGEIRRSASVVYRTAGSLDYKFLIQNMDLFQAKSAQEQTKLIRLARRSFARQRTRLRLYDGIRELLIGAKSQGFKNVCVTNAPFYQVHGRLRRLRLLPFIDGLVAWKGHTIHAGGLEHVLKYQRCLRELGRLQLFHALPRHHLKPSATPFEIVARHFGHDLTYFAVGDSVQKDLDPAKSIGMTTIWARYGTRYNPENFATLLDITPWSPDDVDVHQTFWNFPDHIAETPYDIERLIGFGPN